MSEVQEEKVEVKKEVKPEEKRQEVQVDAITAFNLKILEFDRNISDLESKVASLKSERSNYIYSENVQQVLAVHKERLIKQQIEEETKKKLNDKA